MMLAFEPDLLVRQIADTTDGNPVELLPIINPADPLIYSIGLTSRQNWDTGQLRRGAVILNCRPLV